MTQASLSAIAADLVEYYADLEGVSLAKHTIEALPASVGRRNYLFRYGPYFLKWRSDPHADVEREYEGLRAMRGIQGTVARRSFQVDALRKDAIERRDLTRLAALDRDLGDVLLCLACEGQSLTQPPDDTQIDEAAKLIAHLHAQPIPDEMPPLKVPRRPSTMLRVIADHIDELKAYKLLPAPLQKQLTQARREAEDHAEHSGAFDQWPRVHRLCHGDLRWHNFFATPTGLMLLDFEDAGVCDPAVDLAMMNSRTPLPWFDELRLLDAYQRHSDDEGLLDRYFALRPIVGLMGALGGILDLWDIAAAQRPLVGDRNAHLQRRFPEACHELRDAFTRLGLTPHPSLEHATYPSDWRFPQTSPQRKGSGIIAIDGTASSLKSVFAQHLARALGLPHYNKGALFRYAALWAWHKALDPHDDSDLNTLCDHLRASPPQLTPDGAVSVAGTRYDRSLLLPAVDQNVATWASHPILHHTLQDSIEAALHHTPDAVFEGRDIGLTLAPDARWCYFIDAPLARRAAIFAERSGLSLREAKAQLSQRDGQDKAREYRPMQANDRAQTLTLSPKNVVAQATRCARQIQEALS